jgi:TRAP-type transport system small permease protein
LQTVSNVKDATIKIAIAFANVIMFLMVAMVVVEVLMRWFFDKSTMVSNDFVAYGMGIVFYLGAAKALEENVFVRMDILYDFYKGKFKKVVDLICDFLLLFFNLNITFYFFNLLQNTFVRNLKATNIYETPLWAPRLLVFLGMVLFSIYLICRIIEDFRAKPQKYSSRKLHLMEGLPMDGENEKEEQN